MSTFFENWVQCMDKNGFPVPSVETANEAIEFVHQLHSAWENAGGDEEMTIGALLALGAAAGIDEAALAVLGEIAEVAVLVYIGACTLCIASVAIDDVKLLFANNELPDFMVAQLENQGVDLGGIPA